MHDLEFYIGRDCAASFAKRVKHLEHFPVLAAGDLWCGIHLCRRLGRLYHSLGAANPPLQEEESMKRLKSFLTSWEALLVLLLAIGVVIGAILSPYFLNSFNLEYALPSNIMEIAIMALPMTLIIIAGEIDLSVASLLGLTSVVLGLLWQRGLPMWLAIGVALLVGLLAWRLPCVFGSQLALCS